MTTRTDSDELILRMYDVLLPFDEMHVTIQERRRAYDSDDAEITDNQLTGKIMREDLDEALDMVGKHHKEPYVPIRALAEVPPMLHFRPINGRTSRIERIIVGGIIIFENPDKQFGEGLGARYKI